MGGLTSGWHKIKGSSSTSQDDAPPTDDELRQRILMMAVHRIAEHIVNTDESIDVFLAKYKGALEEGDKQAEAGLWERALETFETAAPLTKHDDDAYRLYNIGVANEALGISGERHENGDEVPGPGGDRVWQGDRCQTGREILPDPAEAD